ncbi:hypothetical protein ACHQM5_021920 [Ranunculus cassubicifolius]
MTGGRKNLKIAAEQKEIFVQEGQSIMQVVSLRGSNVIEVMDARGEKSLARFPATMQRTMWIKRGSFVIINESGRDEAAAAGSKVTCEVSQVLFHEQVRVLQKSPEWPEIFKTATSDNAHPQKVVSENTEKISSTFNEDEEEDDDLPPLEANLNRVRPYESASESESGSDTESEPINQSSESPKLGVS